MPCPRLTKGVPLTTDPPDHHHYRLLFDLYEQLAQLDASSEVPGYIAMLRDEKIDVDSVLTFGKVNAQAMLDFLPVHPPDVLATATWLDGFTLGYLFAVSRPDAP